MSSILIRNVDASTKHAIQQVAAQEGISMEEKLRRVLSQLFLPEQPEKGLGTRMAEAFQDIRNEDYSDFFEALNEIRHAGKSYKERDIFAEGDDAADIE